MIRLLALVTHPRGISPAQRFRIEQWEPYLRRDHGISVDYAAFQSPALRETLYQNKRYLKKSILMTRDAIRHRRIVASARHYDVVLVLRGAALIGPPLYEWLIARSGVPIVYDFDDAIWAREREGVNGIFSRLKFRSKVPMLCRMATVVTAGNRYLASWAKAYNDDVRIVPTSIELDAFPVQPPLKSDDPFVVIWTGSFSTLAHLELARAPLERLAKRRRVRLHVICDRPPSRPFGGMENVFERWRPDAEASMLAAGHVGIMPLPDDEFARGKCACKALQYMAAGRPVIVTPVGINAEIVRQMDNGLIASTDDEWVAAFERLASSPELRQQLAAAGRRTVEDGFSSRHSAELFAKAVSDAVQRSARRNRTNEPRQEAPAT